MYTPMLLPLSTGFTTQGAPTPRHRAGDVNDRTDDLVLRGHHASALPHAFGGVLVQAGARRNRAAADEGNSALFEDFLKLAALAELAMKGGEDHIAGTVEPRQVGGGNVARIDFVTCGFESFDHRSSADQADFSFRTRTTEQNCHFHLLIPFNDSVGSMR